MVKKNLLYRFPYVTVYTRDNGVLTLGPYKNVWGLCSKTKCGKLGISSTQPYRHLNPFLRPQNRPPILNISRGHEIRPRGGLLQSPFSIIYIYIYIPIAIDRACMHENESENRHEATCGSHFCEDQGQLLSIRRDSGLVVVSWLLGSAPSRPDARHAHDAQGRSPGAAGGGHQWFSCCEARW